MTHITVHLTPVLSGVVSDLQYYAADQWWPLVDMPVSVDGVIDLEIGVQYPELLFRIHFPKQTIDGVTYIDKFSISFDLTANRFLNVSMETSEPPPQPPVNDLINLVLPLGFGVAMVFVPNILDKGKE